MHICFCQLGYIPSLSSKRVANSTNTRSNAATLSLDMMIVLYHYTTPRFLFSALLHSKKKKKKNLNLIIATPSGHFINPVAIVQGLVILSVFNTETWTRPGQVCCFFMEAYCHNLVTSQYSDTLNQYFVILSQ